MDGEELKPCPFCGGEAKRIDIDATNPSIPDADGSYIACGRCYACSPIMFGEKTGLEESWNRRALSTIAPDEIRLECAGRGEKKFREMVASPNQRDIPVFKIFRDKQAAELYAAILSAEPAQEECPDCIGRGWITETDRHDMPVQVQCETCLGRGYINDKPAQDDTPHVPGWNGNTYSEPAQDDGKP